jgi:NAD(P)H dehydrogenase (quinone)
MKLGITGATGQLGKLVVEDLKKRTSAENVVALVRTPEKAADLGVEVRAFDYTQPNVESLKGIDNLLLISGNEIGQRETQHKNVINAAKEAGVKRIIYTSLLRADNSTLSLAPEHYATEEALKASGVPFTILRNGWYTENYTGTLAGSVQAGALIGSAGDGKISSAARADYAEAAAVVLTSEGHEGKTYELSGDESYTLTDLAAEVSKQTGKDIPYNNLPEAEYAGALVSIGLPEGMAQFYAAFDTSAAKNDLFDEGKSLSQLIGHTTTPLSDSVKVALA